MAATTTLTSVSTADAVPASAPYKIGSVSGHDRATVKFTVVGDVTHIDPGASVYPGSGVIPDQSPPVSAYRIRLGGVDHATGVKLVGKGLICGPEACGAQPCSSWSVPGGTEITEIITYAETRAPGDGAQTVNVYGYAGVWG